jgi:hypothetical protein
LNEPPNHHYYETLSGQWGAAFEFRIVDSKRFWSTSMGLLDRLQAISMEISRWLIGRPRIETVVDYRADDNAVHHELRIIKWGMTLFRSNEVLELHDDGRSLTIRGEQRSWPLIWRAVDLGVNPGEINETGTGAHYTLQWMGGEMHINTTMVDGGADIEMSTGWGRGVQQLRAR